MDAQQVVVLLLHLLIGILFVVILVVIIHKFLAIALSQLLMHSTLQDKRVQVVAELFKEDKPLTASALLQFLALLQWLCHALMQMETAVLLLVQLAMAPLVTHPMTQVVLQVEDIHVGLVVLVQTQVIAYLLPLPLPLLQQRLQYLLLQLQVQSSAQVLALVLGLLWEAYAVVQLQLLQQQPLL
jgi:hypothetical protein